MQTSLTPDASAIKYRKRKGKSRKINNGDFWRAEVVRKILKNEVYTGELYYGKTKDNKPQDKSLWKKSEHTHEAIISKDQFELAQQRLNDISKRATLKQRKNRDGHQYLLSGLIQCNHCMSLPHEHGKKVMATWVGAKKHKKEDGIKKTHYYYQCGNKNRSKTSHVCPVIPIPALELEQYISEFIVHLLDNPKAVYDYQRNLASSRLSIEHLEHEIENFRKLIKAHPARQEALREQNISGLISIGVLKEEMEKMDKRNDQNILKLQELEYKLNNEKISVGYEYSLKLYSQKYQEVLNQSTLSRDELYELAQALINKIIVYSRPREDGDVISGRKKEGQMIPNRIEIVLNLPKSLIQKITAFEFGVKTPNMCRGWDSNPHEF